MADAFNPIYGLAGALLGAIPGVLGILLPWLRNRDQQAQRIRDMEAAKIEVEFIKTWLSAMAEVSDESSSVYKKTAETRLEQLLKATDTNLPSARSSLQPTQTPAETTKGKAPGIWLYAYCGFWLFMLFGSMIDDKNELSLSYARKELAENTSFFVVITIPLLIMAAVRFFKSRKKSP